MKSQVLPQGVVSQDDQLGGAPVDLVVPLVHPGGDLRVAVPQGVVPLLPGGDAVGAGDGQDGELLRVELLGEPAHLLLLRGEGGLLSLLLFAKGPHSGVLLLFAS